MTSLAVSFPSLQAGGVIIASQHNTNNSDIVTYINNRNTGSTKWEGLSTSGNLSVDGTTTLTGTVTQGAAGTGSLNALITLSGSSASDYGAQLRFSRNSVLKGSIGTVSSIIGGASSDLLLYSVSDAVTIYSGGVTETFRVASTLVDSKVQFKGKGTATNDSAAAGYVGEYSESAITSYGNMAATTTFGNLTTLSLTAGDWDVTGQAFFITNGATQTSGVSLAVSIYSANTTTDHVNGTNVMTIVEPTGGGTVSTGLTYRVSLSGTTTVYLKGKATFSAGTPQYLGTARARRIR